MIAFRVIALVLTLWAYFLGIVVVGTGKLSLDAGVFFGEPLWYQLPQAWSGPQQLYLIVLGGAVGFLGSMIFPKMRENSMYWGPVTMLVGLSGPATAMILGNLLRPL